MKKNSTANKTENVSGGDLNQERNISEDEVLELKAKLEQKTKEADDYVELLQRNLAEFDNYKKRTVKEKDVLYNSALIDIISDVLPIIDNLEKALQSCKGEDQGKIVEGVEMILRQFKDLLKSYSIVEIEAVGQKFSPEFHEAVMHVDDSNYGNNEIIEEFRKGYKLGNKVIRHSMVKVAN